MTLICMYLHSALHRDGIIRISPMWKQKTTNKDFFFPSPLSSPHTDSLQHRSRHRDALSAVLSQQVSYLFTVLFSSSVFHQKIHTHYKHVNINNTPTVTHPHWHMQVNKILRCSVHAAVNHPVTPAHCLGCVRFDKAHITVVPPSDRIWEQVWAKGLTMKCQPPKGQIWAPRDGAYVKPLLSIADALSLKGQCGLIRKVMALLCREP